jgi:hypothetical protein
MGSVGKEGGVGEGDTSEGGLPSCSIHGPLVPGSKLRYINASRSKTMACCRT